MPVKKPKILDILLTIILVTLQSDSNPKIAPAISMKETHVRESYPGVPVCRHSFRLSSFRGFLSWFHVEAWHKLQGTGWHKNAIERPCIEGVPVSPILWGTKTKKTTVI